MILKLSTIVAVFVNFLKIIVQSLYGNIYDTSFVSCKSVVKIIKVQNCTAIMYFNSISYISQNFKRKSNFLTK